MQILNMKAHTAIILDTRKSLKSKPLSGDFNSSSEDLRYPVKLRITFNRKQKYFTADQSLTKNQFNLVFGKNPKGDNKKLRLQFDALEQKANKIIEQMEVFDFALFSKALYSEHQVRDDVYAHYSKIIDSHTKNGNLGTAVNYNCSLKSLKQFRPSFSSWMLQ